MTSRISADTEQCLRAAMARLFDGTAEHTDGALTLANLGREAGISPATVHRATDIKVEFAAEVDRRHAQETRAQLARRQNRIGDLQRKLAERNKEIREMREWGNRMAQQIQYLNLRNNSLLRELQRAKKRTDTTSIEGNGLT